MNNTMSPQMVDLKELYDSNLEVLRDNNSLPNGINFVPGCGPLNPTLMIVGEAPGRLENAKVIPFQGRAGINLRNLLINIGVDPEDTFLTNVVKFWPKDKDGNTRPPTDKEINISVEFLAREIDIINPDLVGLCGLTAIQSLFPEYEKIYPYNGKLFDKRYVFLYHPAYTIYHPHQKPLVKQGFESLKGHILNLKR